MPIPALLRASSLTKTYDGSPALRDVSISLSAGERVALTGPSGSGKTTLLNCLSGIDRPDCGEVWFRDHALHPMSRVELAHLTRREFGSIFQFFHLLPTLSAAENIELPLQLLGVPAAEREERVAKLLERVGLKHRSHALPGQLSGGEMQRVAIARAVSHRPALLLADEPTGNLDSANSAMVLELLREMCAEHGAALLLVTHSEEAAAICSRRIRFRDGSILSEERAE